MSKAKHEVRAAFRDAVFRRATRDGITRCEVCGAHDRPLDAHHIIPREEICGGGYVASNGISLCDAMQGCHWKAERWPIDHETFGRKALFARIGSSEEKARLDAQRRRWPT